MDLHVPVQVQVHASAAARMVICCLEVCAALVSLHGSTVMIALTRAVFTQVLCLTTKQHYDVIMQNIVDDVLCLQKTTLAG